MRPFTVSPARTINLDQVVSWTWAHRVIRDEHMQCEAEYLIVALTSGPEVELDSDEGHRLVEAVGAMATISYFGWDHEPRRAERDGYS